ncbi:MAG: chorismate synthase [Endomicrobia bacterium]|nr:chorismate synthase [Endomicrobiia bacterium]
MIRFFTAGESHNKAVVVFIDGIPSGLKLSLEKISVELKRRRKGYGRTERQSFEEDEFEILSGVRYSETIGSPICIKVLNKDYREQDFLGDKATPALTVPRPGHADLTGAMKFLREDLKDISERSSARETVGRVVAGAICKQLLEQFGVRIGSFVTKIYRVKFDKNYLTVDAGMLIKYHEAAERSSVRFPDILKEKKIIKLIDNVRRNNDTIGGEFVVFAVNIPVGLGSYTQWCDRLNALITYYLTSIPAIKSVEVGLGKKYTDFCGSQVHDEIFYSPKKGFYRKTNNAGGIEGGISNGAPVIVSCSMKPIPTLYKPLKSVDIKTKKSSLANIVRSDICAVASCSVVAESMLAICLADEFKKKFGGDSLREMKLNYKNYQKCLLNF